MERVAAALSGDDPTTKLPPEVEDRLKRGAERLRQIAPKRNEAWEFFRGNHYAYLDEKNVLRFQATGTSITGGGKPAHRERKSYNLILDSVAHEVSAATQRTPSYDVAPTTSDPEDISAAKIAERVALYGHEKWNMRHATVMAVTAALVADESFAWPYFDNSIGPFILDDETGKLVGQGEVRVRIFTGNQVGWEPGVRFEDSPWHYVEYAAPPQQVTGMEGYFGGKLTPDADAEHMAHKGQDSASQTKLVLVRHYLEQPSPEQPRGRWIVAANGRRVVQDRNYPSAEYEDFDGPVLHKLSYIIDPDSDHDMGLVRHELDPQRIHNFAMNKATEWVKVALAPQMVVTPGLLQRQRITDEPGAVYEIPQPDQNMKWREVPPLPRELFELMDRAEASLGRVAAQNDVPSQVESGKGILALNERDDSRRFAFIAQLAGWYSSVMHHNLVLVQKHYSEARTLQIRGRYGWAPLRDFLGASLRSQVDVRVSAASIEPRTKEFVERRVMGYAQLGWITPEVAMSAINAGTAEKLVEGYERDIAYSNRLIQKIKDGPEVLFTQQPRVEADPLTGEPTEIPAWMPRRFHNLRVLQSIFEDFMKGEEYEQLDPPMRDATDQVYDAIIRLDAQKKMEEAQAQQAMAEGQGMFNAAKPQVGKPMPSLPDLPKADPASGKAEPPPTP